MPTHACRAARSTLAPSRPPLAVAVAFPSPIPHQASRR